MASNSVNARDSKSCAWDLAFPEIPGKIVNGVRVPHFVDVEWVEKMKANVKLRPDDVWVVSYPKSGNTWTSQIVRLILNRGEIKDDKNVMEAVLFIEAIHKESPLRWPKDANELDKMPSPRAFKSHFSYEMMPCGLPCSTPGKYIYICRNPKDVAVSFYHHDRRLSFNPTLEWNQHFEVFMKGLVFYGDFFDHVLSWWAHRDDDNVLFLKYEDMKKDLPAAVASIAKFLKQNISQELIDKIADRTTFSNMKKDRLANCEWLDSLQKPGETRFLRKGEVGDWKNYFTLEQKARLDAVYEKRMKETGLDFDFK